MRLHRFYSPESIGSQTRIQIHSADLVHHVRNVFRLKKDDRVVIFDGSGSDHECMIDDFTRGSIILNVATSERSRFTPGRDIYLCAGVVKKDTFEWIVEKATELGVTHVVPILAERSEKKSLNGKRLQKIAIEASEQSGRGNIPTIMPVMTLENALKKLEEVAPLQMLVFHTEAKQFRRSDLSENGSIAVFIGPEGGWSSDELDVFHKRNMNMRSLGNQVLRSETAVIATLSQVVFQS